MMKRFPVSKELAELESVFSGHGYKIYLVGGAVRDHLLGISNHDYDFTTDAEPQEVKAMFKRTIDTGIKHGTVTVMFKGGKYEITTFRSESGYFDMRHPEKVEFIKSLEEDLMRRDFTINAFAADLCTGEIIDLHEGIKDLKLHLIRAIGNPEERFNEDALRMMRACRFSAKLGFEIEKGTFEAMRKLKGNIASVSAERIKEELFSLISSPHPQYGLEAMRESGLMEIIIPELYSCCNVEQKGVHSDDVYTHSVKTLMWAQKNGHKTEVRIAALFHDIGKPATRKEGESRSYTFYNHEKVSAELWRNICARLKTGNDERDKVAHLIENHMFNYDPSWSDAAIRRFMKRIGPENLDDLIDLRMDDAMAISGSFNPSLLLSLLDRIGIEKEKQSAISLKDLKINGRDLIEEKIIPPSKKMGRILELLLDEVVETPSLNRREYLLERARVLAGKDI